MGQILLGLLLAAAPGASGATVSSATAAGAAPAVAASTAAPANAAQIYTAAALRDPFTRAGAAAMKVASRAFAAMDFNIHNLSLKGIIRDDVSDYALLGDNTFGVSFILRKGRLYDEKSKRVSGVTGSLDMKRRMVRVVASDGDVQILRLGETGKE